MEGPILGKIRENHLLTELPLLQSSMEEGTILWYGVECSRSAYRGLRDHICRAILCSFERGSGGKSWKVRDANGGEDILVGKWP